MFHCTSFVNISPLSIPTVKADKDVISINYTAFQPVQVVWPSDPVYGDDIEWLSRTEWNVTLPMVLGKNTSLFGWPYYSREIIYVIVSNFYTEPKNVSCQFLVDDTAIYLSDEYEVPAGTPSDPQNMPGRLEIQIPAPIPAKGFLFSTVGSHRIRARTTVTPSVNEAICHVTVKDTERLTIVYVPVVLTDGATGAPLHAAVNVREHIEQSLKFTRGTYPVAEDEILAIEMPPFYINLTEVRAPDAQFAPLPPPRVSMAKFHTKLAEIIGSITVTGHVRVVGLVPDSYPPYWPAIYHWEENATHIWPASWPGIMTQNIRAVTVVDGWWTTTAHEIGHTFGLWIDYPMDDEEYIQKLPGNAAPGYWVNEKVDKPTTTICFMGTNPHKSFDNWLEKPEYRWLLTNRFNVTSDPGVLFISGLIWLNGTVELGNWYHLALGTPDVPAGATGNYTVVFLNAIGQVVSQVGFNASFTNKDNLGEIDPTGFAFKVPYPSDTARVQIVSNAAVVAERVVSANPPTVTVTHPDGGEVLTPATSHTITWDAYDLDADTLAYSVLYSMDGGQNWIPLTVGLREKTYVWNITTLPSGSTYLVKVMATDGVNTGEDVSNGNFTIAAGHDVAITSVTPSKTVVGQGHSLSINATVENQGDFTENFNVTVYANTTAIQTETLTLTSQSFTTLTFKWNTTGFAKGNYTISAVADTVPGETDTEDNTLIDGWVYVGIPGDLNGDGYVKIGDIVQVISYFGTLPSSPNWNPNADINGDNKVTISDIVLTISHFGESAPP